MQTHSVLITLFDQVQSLDLTGPLEVFATASGSGLTIVPDADLADEETPHTVIAPGGPGSRAPAPELIGWLRAG